MFVLAKKNVIGTSVFFVLAKKKNVIVYFPGRRMKELLLVYIIEKKKLQFPGKTKEKENYYCLIWPGKDKVHSPGGTRS